MIGCYRTGARTACENVLYLLDGLRIISAIKLRYGIALILASIRMMYCTLLKNCLWSINVFCVTRWAKRGLKRTTITFYL